MVLREMEEFAHLALTKLLRAFSEHKEKGVDDIRFAATVGPNDCRKALNHDRL